MQQSTQYENIWLDSIDGKITATVNTSVVYTYTHYFLKRF